MERVDNQNVAAPEITDISGRHRGSLAIWQSASMNGRPTARGDYYVGLRGGFVDGQEVIDNFRGQHYLLQKVVSPGRSLWKLIAATSVVRASPTSHSDPRDRHRGNETHLQPIGRRERPRSPKKADLRLEQGEGPLLAQPPRTPKEELRRHLAVREHEIVPSPVVPTRSREKHAFSHSSARNTLFVLLRYRSA